MFKLLESDVNPHFILHSPSWFLGRSLAEIRFLSDCCAAIIELNGRADRNFRAAVLISDCSPTLGFGWDAAEMERAIATRARLPRSNLVRLGRIILRKEFTKRSVKKH